MVDFPINFLLNFIYFICFGPGLDKILKLYQVYGAFIPQRNHSLDNFGQL